MSDDVNTNIPDEEDVQGEEEVTKNEEYLMKEILDPKDFTGPLGQERYDLLAKIAIRFRSLVEDLENPDVDIRKNAAQLLAKYGDQHVMDYLRAIQMDEKNVLRYFAQQEMDKIRKTLGLVHQPEERDQQKKQSAFVQKITLFIAGLNPTLVFMVIALLVAAGIVSLLIVILL